MKNIMKLFLYAALPLALIALGSCSYTLKTSRSKPTHKQGR